MTDCGSGWKEYAIDSITPGRDALEMAIQGGWTDSEGFVYDGL